MLYPARFNEMIGVILDGRGARGVNKQGGNIRRFLFR